MNVIQIQEAKYLDNYRISIRFSNGEQGVVDLSDLINRFSVAAPLLDTKLFAQFTLDEWPTLVWDCGFDVSPETLYQRATGKSIHWSPRVAA
jgi:hypothetical protein